MDDADRDFQKIYEDYQPKILRYMTRMVGEDEAEDLTQEVFIKANRALDGFRRDSSLSTWLYRIAIHSAYDRMRCPTFRYMAEKRECGGPDEDDLEEITDCDPYSGEKTPLAEQQFDPNGSLLGFNLHTPTGAHCLAALPELFAHDWLMLPESNPGRCRPVACRAGKSGSRRSSNASLTIIHRNNKSARLVPTGRPLVNSTQISLV